MAGGRGGARDYEADGITVHWDPSRCIHSGNCLRGLPAVFDNTARPWVSVGAATADEVALTVDTCPSGALTYTRTDGGAEGPGSSAVRAAAAGATAGGDADGAGGAAGAGEVTVTVRANGPLIVMGAARVLDDAGGELGAGDLLFLCRCGGSGRKPFCDGTHKRSGFVG